MGERFRGVAVSDFAYLGFDKEELRLLSLMLHREGQGVYLSDSAAGTVKGISTRVDDAFKAGVSSCPA